MLDNEIELADLIWQVRRELSQAGWAGESSDLRFEAGPVELELTVAVERSTTPGVKARLLVVDTEMAARRASTVTQRIRLTLQPRLAADPHRSPLISGPAVKGEQ